MSSCMKEVWDNLTNTLNEQKIFWWNKIVEKLNESRRTYHNLKHLEFKYKLYLEVQHLLKDKEAVEYAIFFSYLEYDPTSADAHDRNVEHFKTFANECGLPLSCSVYNDAVFLLSCIGSHITEAHKNENTFGEDDRHYFLDLDMAILGSGPEEYVDYSKRVQKEYDFLTPNVYKALRVKVLQAFLQIPNIFATKYFREKFEGQARSNIQEEIDSLQ